MNSLLLLPSGAEAAMTILIRGPPLKKGKGAHFCAPLCLYADVAKLANATVSKTVNSGRGFAGPNPAVRITKIAHKACRIN
jgi:hypothetical protein